MNNSDPTNQRSLLAVTRAEAAKMLSRKPSTLAAWAVSGCGPKFVRSAGGGVLYSLKEIRDWLERESRSSTSESNV